MRFKSFYVLAMLSVLVSPALARANNLVGLGLGANFSNYTNQGSGPSSNTEFAVTVFADWGLGNIWYLETALRYNSYGLSGPIDGFSVSEDANYLEIPILIKPTFDAGGWFPYVLAGPVVGFKVGEGYNFNDNGVSVNGSTDLFNTMNFSADFGAGAEVPIIPNLRAFAQFDYELGFINVMQSDSGTSAHTRGAVVSAGAAWVF
jgi:hypothetical protein